MRYRGAIHDPLKLADAIDPIHKDLFDTWKSQIISILNDNDAAIRRGTGLRVVLELRSGGKIAGAKCTTFYGCVDTEGR